MPDLQDLSAVEALLQERDAIAGWLARLDEQGVGAPESVRARVRQDYLDRLEGLTDQLRHHADTLTARLGADQREHDDLMQRARSSREALAEVELRHGVGEYDDARFERERQRHVAELEQVETALGAVGERIARLEEVHHLVSAPARSGPAESAAPVAPEEPVTIPPEPMPWPEEAPPEPEPAASAEVIELSGVEEPEDAEADTDDLLSIFDRVEDDGEERDAERGAPPLPSRGDTPGFGPLSFTPTGGEPSPPSRPSAPPGAPPLGMPGADQSPRFVPPRQERGGGRHATSESRAAVEAIRVIPDPDPILPEVPPDTGGEVVARTLRCGECGAMNRPLEWYCEKCGAELTAV